LGLWHVLVDQEGLLVVREHDGDLRSCPMLPEPIGWVASAEYTLYVNAVEVVHCILIVRPHEAILLEHGFVSVFWTIGARYLYSTQKWAYIDPTLLRFDGGCGTNKKTVFTYWWY
jgi:hypothetical protein